MGEEEEKKKKVKSRGILKEIGRLFDSAFDAISRSQDPWGPKPEDTILGSESGFMIEDETRKRWKYLKGSYVAKRRREETAKDKFIKSRQIWWRTKDLPHPLGFPDKSKQKRVAISGKIVGLSVFISIIVFYAMYLHAIYFHEWVDAIQSGVPPAFYAEWAIANWPSIILNIWPGDGFRLSAEIFLALNYIPPRAVWVNAIGWVIIGFDFGICASMIKGVESRIRPYEPFPPSGPIIHS